MKRNTPSLHIDSDSLAVIFTFLPKVVLLQTVVPVCRYWAHFSLSSVVWDEYDWSQKNIAFVVKFATTYGPYMSSLCFNNCRYMTENVFEQCIQNCHNLTELNLENCNALQRIRTVAGKKEKKSQMLSEDLFRNLTSLSVAYTSIAVPDVRNIISLCAGTLQVLDLRGLSFKFSNLFVKIIGRNEPPSVLSLPNVHTFKLGGYNRSLSKSELNDLFAIWLPNVTDLTVSSFSHVNSGSIEILNNANRWELTKLEISSVDVSLRCAKMENSYSTQKLLSQISDKIIHLSVEIQNIFSLEGFDQFFARKNLSLQSLTITVVYYDDYYTVFQPRDNIIAEILLNAPVNLREFELKLIGPPLWRTLSEPVYEPTPLVPLDSLKHQFTKFKVNRLIVSPVWFEHIQKLNLRLRIQ